MPVEGRCGRAVIVVLGGGQELDPPLFPKVSAPWFTPFSIPASPLTEIDRLRVQLAQRSGRGTTRAEGDEGTPTQSHISPSILVYDDDSSKFTAVGVDDLHHLLQ